MSKATHQLASHSACTPVPDLLQVDLTCVSRTEAECYLPAGLCLFCAAPGHFIIDCLIKPPRPVLSPDSQIMPVVASEYSAFQDVFSKWAATHLPPYQTWDCTIELLPRAQGYGGVCRGGSSTINFTST